MSRPWWKHPGVWGVIVILLALGCVVPSLMVYLWLFVWP